MILDGLGTSALFLLPSKASTTPGKEEYLGSAMGWIVHPPNSYLEAFTPVLQKVIVFGETAFKEVIKLN